MAIGKLFHIIHMTGDLPALEAWYDDVFSAQRGFLDEPSVNILELSNHVLGCRC
jgi:hypothetical protein